MHVLLLLAVASLLAVVPRVAHCRPTAAESGGEQGDNPKKWPTVTLKLTAEEHEQLLGDLQAYIASRRADGDNPSKATLRAYVLNWYLELRREQARRYWDAVQRVLRPGRGPWTM